MATALEEKELLRMTLEELKREWQEYLTEESEGCAPWTHDLDKLDSFAEKVWNTALDACREKAEKLDPMGNGIDTHEILEAIDSLRA